MVPKGILLKNLLLMSCDDKNVLKLLAVVYAPQIPLP
jgi:hypothetical protein